MTEVLKPPAAAKFLGVSVPTLRSLRKAGKVRGVEFGPRCIRYRLVDLKDCLERLASGSR